MGDLYSKVICDAFRVCDLCGLETDPSLWDENAVGIEGKAPWTILRPDHVVEELAASLLANKIIRPSRTFHPASDANIESYMVVARQVIT